jgi:serine/threonine-protein kinase RsbW
MANHEIAREGTRSTVRLGAKLTAVDVPELQAALKAEIAAGSREVAFDMAALRSLDSTGIGLLVATNNSLQAAQGSVRLDRVPPDLMKLLRGMRLVDRLHATAASAADAKDLPHG